MYVLFSVREAIYNDIQYLFLILQIKTSHTAGPWTQASKCLHVFLSQIFISKGNSVIDKKISGRNIYGGSNQFQFVGSGAMGTVG